VLREYATHAGQEARTQPPAKLPNTDFDTGKPTRAGQYALADETYGEWLRRLADDEFAAVTPAVRLHVLRFFEAGALPQLQGEAQDARTWAKTHRALQQLRALSDGQ
jgi:hypothetical protein